MSNVAQAGRVGRLESSFSSEVVMLLTTPVAVSVFLLGAASGALLVSLRYLAFRNRLYQEAAEDLRRALFRKRRRKPPASFGGDVTATADNLDSCGFAAEAPDKHVGWP